MTTKLKLDMFYCSQLGLTGWGIFLFVFPLLFLERFSHLLSVPSTVMVCPALIGFTWQGPSSCIKAQMVPLDLVSVLCVRVTVWLVPAFLLCFASTPLEWLPPSDWHTGFVPHLLETFCFWNWLCFTDHFHQLLLLFHFISTTCFSFSFHLVFSHKMWNSAVLKLVKMLKQLAVTETNNSHRLIETKNLIRCSQTWL